MDNDEAYDMGYTDGHQDGAREAWLIATPIIHKLRAALRMFACACADEHLCSVPDNCRNYLARAALEEK